MTIDRYSYSYIGIDRQFIGIKQTADIASKQNTVLDGVYGSIRFIGRRNSDPTIVFTIIPVFLVCQRKYMSGFESGPAAKVR